MKDINQYNVVTYLLLLLLTLFLTMLLLLLFRIFPDVFEQFFQTFLKLFSIICCCCMEGSSTATTVKPNSPEYVFQLLKGKKAEEKFAGLLILSRYVKMKNKTKAVGLLLKKALDCLGLDFFSKMLNSKSGSCCCCCCYYFFFFSCSCCCCF